MSVAIPVVESWDGEARRIYLKQGVTSFHPVEDVYKEYRSARRLDESLRKWFPLLKADGSVPKGGGKATERYLVLLHGTKIIPYNESNTINVLGELITDDQTSPFDISSITNPIIIKFTPPATEIVYVNTSGQAVNASEIANAVWASPTRTLTSLGDLISNIWSYATRSLSSSGVKEIAVAQAKFGYDTDIANKQIIQLDPEGNIVARFNCYDEFGNKSLINIKKMVLDV